MLPLVLSATYAKVSRYDSDVFSLPFSLSQFLFLEIGPLPSNAVVLSLKNDLVLLQVTGPRPKVVYGDFEREMPPSPVLVTTS